MALVLSQQLKMTQQLLMTPQLQQAIKLLQLSRLELAKGRGGGGRIDRWMLGVIRASSRDKVLAGMAGCDHVL